MKAPSQCALKFRGQKSTQEEPVALLNCCAIMPYFLTVKWLLASIRETLEGKLCRQENAVVAGV
jgi:hypothetical protein